MERLSFPWIGRLNIMNLSFFPKINLKIQHNLNKTLNGMIYGN